MTPERRAELRALREAAAKGSWVGSPSGVLSGGTWVVENTPDDSGAIMGSENAECIAAAVNALVPLLDALDAAEAEHDRLRQHIDAAGDGMNLCALLDLYHDRAIAAEKRVAELEAVLKEIEPGGCPCCGSEPWVNIDCHVCVAASEALKGGK